MANLRYFTLAFVLTVLGLALGTWLGWLDTGTVPGALETLLICSILAILEVSLSFDNAIVNARILRDMSPKWQHRFLTWGIIIAVFGMRILFPLIIVAIAARIDPISAVHLAVTDHAEYARLLGNAHVGISAFGGSFLFMVALSYFFDPEKEVHWISAVESRLAKFASIHGIELGIVLVLIVIFAMQLPQEDSHTFMLAGICGLITFLAVEGIGDFLDATQEQMDVVHRAGVASFIYLEVLDASFSFDGVIGAFALSNDLFVIAIGLGIGAIYVRSMTLMLVEKGTLAAYRYLEHGAFYAILVLAAIMYIQTLAEVPEVVTGLLGAFLIGLALWSSIAYNRRESSAAGEAETHEASAGE